MDLLISLMASVGFYSFFIFLFWFAISLLLKKDIREPLRGMAICIFSFFISSNFDLI